MRTMGNFRRHARLAGLLLLALTVAATVDGQVAPSGFFTDPVLILAGEGHQAPVRSMTFTPDGAQLLTGGMDKVVRVWNLGPGRTRLARTLRPPNWRGGRGQVNALSLSPRPFEGNQRLLAVAGHGVLADRGEILLFDYPGVGRPRDRATSAGNSRPARHWRGRPAEPGHGDVVTSIGFHPGWAVPRLGEQRPNGPDLGRRGPEAGLGDGPGHGAGQLHRHLRRRFAPGGRAAGTARSASTTSPIGPGPDGSRRAGRNPPTPANPLAGTILSLAVSRRRPLGVRRDRGRPADPPRRRHDGRGDPDPVDGPGRGGLRQHGRPADGHQHRRPERRRSPRRSPDPLVRRPGPFGARG